jgi:hypothetical protein
VSHVVAFCYPNAPGRGFDLRHFVEVHLPLGLSQTLKHLGLKPRKLVVYSPILNVGAAGAPLPYLAISSVFFDTRADADRFATLFSYEEAARLLSADFPNYTPGPPDVMLTEVHELDDVDAIIAKHGR